MPTITHPKSTSQITKEWVKYIFNEARICDYGTIASIRIESMGSDIKGFLSSMCRVNIEYKTPEADLPESVVIKMPPEVKENRDFANDFKANAREIRFYQELAPNVSIRIPKCLYSHADDQSDNFILVLEDEKEWSPGDQVTGLTESQVRSAVGMISKFHAQWWESSELEKLSWMPLQNRDLANAYISNWNDFLSDHRDILDGNDINAGELIKISGGTIKEYSLNAPQTVTHMDFRADNILFKKEDEVLILDWQVACRTMGAFDVARVVCGSYHDQKTREEHIDFVQIWLQGLLESGVKTYTFEDAWRDYRVGILILSYIPVTAHHLISHEGHRGQALLKAMIQRIYHAIHETDALDLIT